MDGARAVVAVDFGTTFSGFAYAHRDSPADVHKLYEWDGSMEADAVAYCKTQTSLYYAKLPDGGLQLKEWGWPAFNTYNEDCNRRAAAADAANDRLELTTTGTAATEFQQASTAMVSNFEHWQLDCTTSTTTVASVFEQTSTRTASEQQDFTAMANKQEDFTAMANKQQDFTAMANKQQDFTAMANKQEDFTAMANKQQDFAAMANKQQDFAAMANKQQDFPAMANKQEDFTAMANKQQDFTVMANKQQDFSTIIASDRYREQQDVTTINASEHQASRVEVTHIQDGKVASELESTTSDTAAADEGYFVHWFKLHLAGASSVRDSAGGQSAPDLPPGLTVETAITDYLTCLSTFVIRQLQQKYGQQLTANEVQWCLTVPAIWDDSAKQKMKVYAEKAGMIQGRYTPEGVQASPHNLIICLEPEAASLYCLALCKDIQLQQGDQYLIADIGGGTVDIVVHEKSSSSSTLHGREVKVKEVVASYGGLCGGTYVDKNFDDFLNKTIGCFQEFTSSMNNMNLRLEVHRKWEMGKRSYNGKLRASFVFQFSSGLADAWKKWDKDAGLKPRKRYDQLVLTNQDMKLIFDPVVDEIIRLINKELTPRINTIMLVGGFSSSPYLKARITQAFSNKVRSITNPPEAGAAICHGAVLMGLAPDAAIVSRIARKTYGIGTMRDFRKGDPPEKKLVVDGVKMCDDVFQAYAKKGAVLLVNEAVCHNFWPAYSESREIEFPIYSSPVLENPRYTTDEGVVLEGTFGMDISDELKLGTERSIEVNMLFGKSSIEVQGRRCNFGDTTLIENFFLSLDD